MADKVISRTVKDPTAKEVRQVAVTFLDGSPDRISIAYDLIDSTGASYRGPRQVEYAPTAAVKTAILNMVNSTGLQKIRDEEGL